MEEKNVFKKMENQENQETVKPKTNSNEVDYDKLSEKPVGESIKYVRESLDGKETIIDKATLFKANTAEEPITALNDKTKKYYKCNFIVTYDAKNSDGINHREYMSGIIQFIQADGTLSTPSFWYKGAKNQVAQLWELVAKKQEKEPEDLSPREFMGFLNSKPKTIPKYTEIDYLGKTHYKNLISKFV